MIFRNLNTLAENVFLYGDLPKIIDLSDFNKTLTNKCAVAFYREEVLNEVIALPFKEIGKKDIYNRPTTIQCYGKNGYQSRILKPEEYVIMWDNNSRIPLWIDLEQYAERLALIQRVIDINITQQKTPRIIKTPQELKKTLEMLTNDIDSNVETILSYDKINLIDVETILTPAPYVADKLREEYNNLWSEALRIIGITNLTINKKERMISDEVQYMQGGTVASRFNRYEPRKRAIEEINKKFGLNMSVKFYDDFEKKEEYNEEEEPNNVL